ncbi:MAG: hypothetical protein AAGG00_02725 [Cyanobacteria bacterium P01_H01_bin.150]
MNQPLNRDISKDYGWRYAEHDAAGITPEQGWDKLHFAPVPLFSIFYDLKTRE